MYFFQDISYSEIALNMKEYLKETLFAWLLHHSIPSGM
jgi:hypothetical protein